MGGEEEVQKSNDESRKKKRKKKRYLPFVPARNRCNIVYCVHYPEMYEITQGIRRLHA